MNEKGEALTLFFSILGSLLYSYWGFVRKDSSIVARSITIFSLYIC